MKLEASKRLTASKAVGEAFDLENPLDEELYEALFRISKANKDFTMHREEMLLTFYVRGKPVLAFDLELEECFGPR